MIKIMDNYSSNSPVNKGIGWRSLFWSAIGLLAVGGVAYALGYELVWSILSLMAVVVIFIFSFVSCLPEKGNNDAGWGYFRHSLASIPIGYKFVLDLACLAVLGMLIGFDDWYVWTLVALIVLIDCTIFYKARKRDKGSVPSV